MEKMADQELNCMDNVFRGFGVGTFVGGLAALIICRRPVTAFSTVAFCSGLGVGSGVTSCRIHLGDIDRTPEAGSPPALPPRTPPCRIPIFPPLPFPPPMPTIPPLLFPPRTPQPVIQQSDTALQAEPQDTDRLLKILCFTSIAASFLFLKRRAAPWDSNNSILGVWLGAGGLGYGIFQRTQTIVLQKIEELQKETEEHRKETQKIRNIVEGGEGRRKVRIESCRGED